MLLAPPTRRTSYFPAISNINMADARTCDMGGADANVTRSALWQSNESLCFVMGDDDDDDDDV